MYQHNPAYRRLIRFCHFWAAICRRIIACLWLRAAIKRWGGITRMKYITANQRSKYQVYIMCCWFLFVIRMLHEPTSTSRDYEEISTTTRSCGRMYGLRTHTIYLCVECWTRNIIIASHHIDEAPEYYRLHTALPSCVCVCSRIVYVLWRSVCAVAVAANAAAAARSEWRATINDRSDGSTPPMRGRG